MADGGRVARRDPLWRTLTVLPTDYTDYGGDVVRWAEPTADYPDCSCGCKYARYLAGSGDWLVCANPDGPRLGLLTWEHQAGSDCFVDYRASADNE